MKLFLIGFVVAVIAIIGGAVVLRNPSVEVSMPAPLVPARGTSITIRDCKADPYILEAQKGSEISLVNADAQARTLFLAKPEGGSEIALPANGSLKLEIDSSFLRIIPMMSSTYSFFGFI